LPPDDADFSTRWRLIKSHFARALPKRERLSAVRVARNERGIWQRRFWEHLIRDEADYARHVEPRRFGGCNGQKDGGLRFANPPYGLGAHRRTRSRDVGLRCVRRRR